MNLPLTNIYKNSTATFTGHRPAKLAAGKANPYKKEHYMLFVPMLTDALEDYLLIGIDTFITGGAQGIDQLVFWAVNILKNRHPEKTIRNIVYAPYKNQSAVWKGNDIFSPGNYKKILACADEVHYCTDLDTATASKAEIVKALDYRNQCMINNAGRLCAFWSNAEFITGRLEPSGTNNAVKFAKSIGTPTDQIVYGNLNKQLILI